MKFTILSILLLSLSVFGQTKPNVVFILSDDQAWGDYGFMGSKEVQTPHIDKLAQESLVFKRGYVTSPLCRPSLASMATGLHTHQHRVTGNDVDGRNNRAELDKPVQKFFNQQASFIKELVKNGYLAHQSGKWWEGSWKDGGFTHGMTHGDPKRKGRHGDEGLSIGRKGMKPVTDFIDSAVVKQKPFVIWYAPFLPHTPHNPPERLLKKYQQEGRGKDAAKYFAMIDWFDETCGELLDYIITKEQEDNTLVVYISDNGWKAPSQSDMRIPKNWNQGYAPRSKGSPYENGIRTPIMFKLPRKIKAQFSDDLASAVDLFPTILAACGFDAPKNLPGINLLDTEIRKERKVIFGAAYSIYNMTVGNPADTRQYRWAITKKWKYLLRDKGSDTTKYKYVHQWDTIPEHLYDLEKDQGEKLNVVSDFPKATQKLKAKLNNWLSD